MDGLEVGTIRIQRGRYQLESGTERIFMVALTNSKHTLLMLSNWRTTRRKEEGEIQCVGGELVWFQYPEIHNWYYFARHSVDNNNNNRQG